MTDSYKDIALYECIFIMTTTITTQHRLLTTNEGDVPYFSFKGRKFWAKPVNVYDGDTFSIIFEFGEGGELMKYRCRCYGYDSAEIKPRLNTVGRDEEIAKAKTAKARLTELLGTGLVRVECLEFDKYGRILVHVWNQTDSRSLNEIMVAEGHGKPYFGGTK